MIEKMKTYKVEFTTAFAGSSIVPIILEAKDESHAQWVARNLCRFGYISDGPMVVNDEPYYTEETHAYAYDENYEVYS
jgi:succinate dehydrogenase/fumarate reductase-like Fe-S protein